MGMGLYTILNQINLSKIDLLFPRKNNKGRKPYLRSALILALLVRELRGILGYEQLEEFLNGHACWARLCGFNDGKIPDATLFCKFLKSLDLERLVMIQKIILAELQRLELLSTDWAMDSEVLPACLWDKEAKWGHTNNPHARLPKEKLEYGYRIHVIVDTKTGLPLAVIVTPGNTDEYSQAIPLLNDATISPFEKLRYLQPSHVIADKGYDSREIRDFIRFLRAKDIIPQREMTGIKIRYERRWKYRYKKRTTVERFHSRLNTLVDLQKFRVTGLDAVTKWVNLAVTAMLIAALWAVHKRKRRKASRTKEIYRDIVRCG
jgi:transposase